VLPLSLVVRLLKMKMKMKMKTVASFMNAQDAHLLRIRLQDAGISAIVCDEATSNVEIAAGGLHLLG
jgi:hypothetical protein